MRHLGCIYQLWVSLPYSLSIYIDTLHIYTHTQMHTSTHIYTPTHTYVHTTTSTTNHKHHHSVQLALRAHMYTCLCTPVNEPVSIQKHHHSVQVAVCTHMCTPVTGQVSIRKHHQCTLQRVKTILGTDRRIIQ